MYYMASLKGMKKKDADEQIPKLIKMINLTGHEDLISDIKKFSNDSLIKVKKSAGRFDLSADFDFN